MPTVIRRAVALLEARIRVATLEAQLLEQQRLDQVARAIALGVEEHFAARLKADPATAITAQDKAERFVAELLEEYPTLGRAEAFRLAERTVAAAGLGATALR